MSNFSGYKIKSFSESQKFFVLDPNTGSPSFVNGADLVKQLTPNQNYVYSEATRTTAEATDYPVGALIETAGATTAGDNFAAVYLVVPAGEGDFPMQNGNSLLIIRGDEFLREQLAQTTPGTGSDLIAHTGTTESVTEALDKRTIYVGSVQELVAISSPLDGTHYDVTGYKPGSAAMIRPNGGGVFYYDSSRSKAEHNGGTVIDPGKTFPSDWSVTADVQNWYVADGVGSGCFVRSSSGRMSSKQFGAWCDGSMDDYHAIQALFNSIPRSGIVTLNGGSFSSDTLVLPDTAVLATIMGDGQNEPLVVDNLIAIKLQAEAVTFSGVRMLARTRNEPNAYAIVDDRQSVGINSADFDLNIINDCRISEFRTAVLSRGRGVTIRDSGVATCNASIIEAQWPDSFVPGPEDVQSAEAGFRAFRIENNRLHYCAGFIMSNEGANAQNLNGVSITGNYIDGSSRYFKGYCRNLNVSGNTHIHAGLFYLLEMDGFENLSIKGNNISGGRQVDGLSTFDRLALLSGNCKNIVIDSTITQFNSDLVYGQSATIENMTVNISGIKNACLTNGSLIRIDSTSSIDGLFVKGLYPKGESWKVVEREGTPTVSNWRIEPLGDLPLVIHNLPAVSSRNLTTSVAGAYGGDGTASKEIDVGYAPSVVQIIGAGKAQTRVAESAAAAPDIEITTTGFSVSGSLNVAGEIFSYRTN